MTTAKLLDLATALESIKEDTTGEFEDISKDQSEKITEIQESIDYSVDEIGKGLEALVELSDLANKINSYQSKGIATESYSDIAQIAFDSIKKNIGLENDKTPVVGLEGFADKLIESIKNIFSKVEEKVEETTSTAKTKIENKTDEIANKADSISEKAPIKSTTRTLDDKDVYLHALAYMYDTNHLTYDIVFPNIKSIFSKYEKAVNLLNDGYLDILKNIVDNPGIISDPNKITKYINKQLEDIFNSVPGKVGKADRVYFQLYDNEEKLFKNAGPINVVLVRTHSKDKENFYNLTINNLNGYVDNKKSVKIDLLTKAVIEKDIKKYLEDYNKQADDIFALSQKALIRYKNFINILFDKIDKLSENDGTKPYLNKTANVVIMFIKILTTMLDRHNNALNHYLDMLNAYIAYSNHYSS